MDKIGISIDLQKCGFIQNPNTHKWARKENGFVLPNTHAQYIDYDSKYQYSPVKKLR